MKEEIQRLVGTDEEILEKACLVAWGRVLILVGVRVHTRCIDQTYPSDTFSSVVFNYK